MRLTEFLMVPEVVHVTFIFMMFIMSGNASLATILAINVLRIQLQPARIAIPEILGIY